MEQSKANRRAKRSFTAEFRAGAVALVLDEEKTVARTHAPCLLT